MHEKVSDSQNTLLWLLYIDYYVKLKFLKNATCLRIGTGPLNCLHSVFTCLILLRPIKST